MKSTLEPNEPILEEAKHEEEDHDDLPEDNAELRKTVKFAADPENEEREDPAIDSPAEEAPEVEVVSAERAHELVDEEFGKEYPESELYRTFLLLFCGNVLVNADHGALPAASEEIKAKMGLENVGFGALGTLVYAGLTLGSALAAKGFSNSKRVKPLLTTSLALNGVFLLAFTVSRSFPFNLFVRFMTGAVQVSLAIFMPVWADAFGSRKGKAMWITVLLLASPLGIFLGFSVTSVFVSYPDLGWEWSFYVQAACILPLTIALSRADARYLDVDAAHTHREKCAEKVGQTHQDEEKVKEGLERQREEEQAAERKKSLMQNPVMQEYLEVRSHISVSQARAPRGRLGGNMSVREGSLLGVPHYTAQRVLNSVRGKSVKSKSEKGGF